jgi:hypothetical protein
VVYSGISRVFQERRIFSDSACHLFAMILLAALYVTLSRRFSLRFGSTGGALSLSSFVEESAMCCQHGTRHNGVQDGSDSSAFSSNSLVSEQCPTEESLSSELTSCLDVNGPIKA